MSLSFEDSLKKARQESEAIVRAVNAPSVMTLESYDVAENENQIIAAYSGEDGNWMQHPNYVYYSDYYDDNVSSVDGKKNILLNEDQINITQEENSQLIPFEMPRYYDGFDLTTTTLSIHYKTSGGYHGVSIPVNVTYNNEKIRFSWLVDANVTHAVGSVLFEIHATGINSKGDAYVWKSRSNNKLNVLESLCENCEEVINVDDSWVKELVETVATNVADKIADAQIGDQVIIAQTAADNAQSYAASASASANEAAQNAQLAVQKELENYATKEYVDSLDISSQLKDYTTKTYVDEAIESIDVTDQLNNYYTKTESYNKDEVNSVLSDYALKTDVVAMIAANPQNYATESFVHEQIELADISDKLNNYYSKDETYSKEEVDTALGNVNVDLTGYATEKYVDEKVSVVSSSISTNAENISSLSTTVGDIQNTVNSIDTSPRLTYDVVYNDVENADVGENVFVFYEIENEGKENEVREAKKKFTIVGGNGGGATSSSLKIGFVTTSPFVVTTNDKAVIKYTFSGTDSSGDIVTEGNATWKVAGRIVATNTALNGENSFDVTEYLSIGTQKVNLSIVDEAGSLVTKTWTVQKIDVKLESTFNDKLTYPMGTISFDYTPYGAISKYVHFVLDGKEIGTVVTSSSGIPMAYEIPAQKHGSHLLEVYMDANVNNNDIESNHIVKDIIWYDSASTIPVIGTVYQDFTARQYDATNIEYTVYDPMTETPTVEIAVDGVVVSTPTLDKATNIYSFKTDIVGDHIITITCGETVKILNVNITKLDINISPVTAGLVFDFNPSGKSNNDSDRIWSNGVVSMEVSDDFDWVNGGYQYDENGDQYFCIKAGTSATINYELFADDAKKNGKEMKLVFKTVNVAKPNATFLSCMDNTTDADHIGIRMDTHEAFIYGQAGNLHLPYSEEDIIEFEFNISKNTEAVPMVMGYEDGVSTRPMVYDDSYNFTQNTPKIISLGSDDCDLHIYRFKVYNASLTDRGILNNFIADARNAEEMVKRYDRNQIYNENSQLDPDILAEKCPWLRVYKLSAPYFTNNKSDKVSNTTIQQIYKNGDPVLDNWTCYNAMHSGQGTSSNNYGAAGRNLDFIMNNSGIDGVESYFKLGDGSEVKEITMTRNSVPVAYLNAKVNIASSNNMTNAILANRYNEFNPYKRPFIRDEGVNTSFIKDTMEFNNCVIFIQETNEDISTHREFADNDWHFYAIGNIGDSKKTDNTRLTDMNDPYEFCVEIMDVELPLSDFPVNTMYNAMGYKVDEKTEEKIYTWAKNENLGILHELIDGEYVLTQDEEIDLNKTYYVDILEHDDFSESFTYGWRYISNKKNADIVNSCKQKWIEFYRFVTTSTDEEFKANLGNYMVVDSALYYYLFTTRYTMVDNRAKNSFWHYSKTGEVDLHGNPIRKFDLNWLYDADTAVGLNNYGKQVYRYGLEDIDRDEKGEEVFREMDSTFFCRIRDLFGSELKSLYNTLESKNAWHAESFINKADEWQNQFPEELWRLDIERKYIRTYNESFINGEGDSQFLVNMANGKMKYHRRQWERSQEKYMASKYQSSVASSDNSVFRCSVPNGDLVVQPNYRLKLTPYAYMYLNVKYGTQNPIQLRAEPNKVYEIPFGGEKADIVDIYSSSLIQDFGDLSTCYVATADTSKASKVKRLIFGNATSGYNNPNFTTLTTGANYLLEVLNIENVSGLTQSLNLSALNNLRELYAHGSNIGGVTFSDGGKIQIAELPSISAMSMKNLIYLTTLDVTDFSKLTTLTVENCNTVDLLTIFRNATNINRIRIVGIDWSLENTSLLDRLYAMKGIDKNGYNADQSVLTGKVFVPVVRQQQLNDYHKAWPDLEVTFNTMIEQYAVTFVNDDENSTILEVQYVDKGSDAVDPVTRKNNPIAVPTKASTISTDYTYAGWDSLLTGIFDNRTVTATYTESTRSYTIKYVSKGITLQESTGLYGSNIVYEGSTPVYTLEESAYKYYLFNRWDKSGFIDGDKIVNAIFDSFEYTPTAFNGKELKDLTPVQIYAITKLGLDSVSIDIQDGDDYSFNLGYDIDYDDIESELIISEKQVFNGTNHLDTGIKLFDEDKDFVLAIDYEVSNETPVNSVLAQCFQSNGSNGFKLWYNSGVKFTWGTSSTSPTAENSREMIVIRHKKGDNNLIIYNSDLSSSEFNVVELPRNKNTISDSTLVFGCMKADDGAYENYAVGNINWCKIWYKDLGEKACGELVGWVHEKINLEVCGFKRYYLSNNPSQRCSFSLLATHLLDRKRSYNSTSTNAGGWASSSLNEYLNTRLYNSIPTQIKSLMKQVIVSSSIGSQSIEISSSNCYVTIPSVIEVSNESSINVEPYIYEGSTISYMTSNNMRRRMFSNGNYGGYWLRSPNISYSNSYVYQVDEYGKLYGFGTPKSASGVLIEISF